MEDVRVTVRIMMARTRASVQMDLGCLLTVIPVQVG